MIQIYNRLIFIEINQKQILRSNQEDFDIKTKKVLFCYMD